jgi:hypothetical protein
MATVEAQTEVQLALPFVEKIEAARLADQADRVEAARGVMAEAIDFIIEGAYSQPSHRKKRAKGKLVEAWLIVARAVQALSKPSPKFRPNVTTFRPIVRHRGPEVVGIEDLQPLSLLRTLKAVAL